jgi:hypothetical protein
MITMSSPFKISLSIWARTLLFNIVLVGCYAFYVEGFKAVFGLILMTIAAFITTLPLLSIINPLVKWMTVIAYSPESRLATLGFLLILMAIAFYAVCGTLVWFVIGAEIFTDGILHLLVSATIIAIILATWSVKTSFIKLNSENHEEQLG